MVMLEAACFGVPSLCFDRCGGAPEFVEDDAGFVVPHLDAMAMAEHVIQLAEDRSLRDRLGRGAEKKVRDRYDVSVVAPQILKIIREM